MTGSPIIGAQCVNLSVADLDRAESWYRDILGFRTVSRERYDAMSLEIAFMDLADFVIELIQYDDAKSGGVFADPPHHANMRGITHFALRVSDLDVMATQLSAKGVPILFGPRALAGMKLCFVRDADGNLIKFVERLAQ